MANYTATGKHTISTPSSLPLLILSWLWVGVPLAWGIWETLRSSAALWRSAG